MNVILREDGSAVVTTYPSDERTVTTGSALGPSRWPVDLSQQMTLQLKDMERLVDAETGAILFGHPTLRGIPDLVLEGDGYTLEFIGPTLLCLDIRDASGMARLLAEPLKDHLPVDV